MHENMPAIPSSGSLGLAREGARPAPCAATPRKVRSRRSTGEFVIETVDTLAGMRALEREWRMLEDEAAASHNFFQSFDWNMRWAERFLNHPKCETPCILAGRERGRLVMLWPLMIACDGPFCTLKWLSDPFPQYGDILLARDVNRQDRMAAAWQHIEALPGIDCIVLRKVREDSAVAPLLAAHCAATAEERVGCYIEIGGVASHEELLAALPSRRRQLRRKLRRNLEDKGALEFSMLFDGEGFERTIRETMRLKRRWLADTGLVSRPVSDPRLDELLCSFAGQPEGASRVAAATLKCGGRPVAYEIAFQYRLHHYLYIITQDNDFAALSPSKVEIDDAQAWCVEHGFEVFDLLPPSDRYKRDLSDRTVRIDDFATAATFKGRLYLAYLTRARPLLKDLYMKYGTGLVARLRGGRGAAPRTEDKSND